MADDDDNSASDDAATTGSGAGRRRVLMLGALAASSVVTIRPALAQTAGSVLNCKIPIPDPPHSGRYIDANGGLVPPRTQGAFAPPPRPITGEEAKRLIQNNLSPPGFDPNARDAYVKYIRRLQKGTSGFTCYTSLQMPRA